MINVPSPAVAIVGRHNSGKTTLIENLISQLVKWGYDVGSIKHHSHAGFDIDYPGKDSYRHRQAGASETVIAAPGMVARVKTVEQEEECSNLVKSMPGHDVVIVEGYRKSGLPTIEIMRAGNPADMRVAEAFAQGASQGWQLGTDFSQVSRGASPVENRDLVEKMPTAQTVAVVTDIPLAVQAAESYGIPSFDIGDYAGLASFLEEHYARPRVTVVIQAGGESRRMGRSKATVPFAGRPLICRLVERLAPVADELIVTTNEPENLCFLHQMYPQHGIRLVRDSFDTRGALPGLHTALNAAGNPFVAIVACDMIFASASLVVAEALAMAESGVDAVIPVNKHGYEPFHAIYRKDACLPAVEAALERGNSRAQSFLGDVDVLEFPQSRVLEAEPMGGCFVNANTPEELHSIEESFLHR